MTKHHIYRWLLRYGPAEVLSTVATAACVWCCLVLWQSPLLAATLSPWAANVGFYGTFLVQRVWQNSVTHVLPHLREMLVEFGPSELLDSVATLPSMLYACLLILDPITATAVAKVMADLCFYLPAIVTYELRGRTA